MNWDNTENSTSGTGQDSPQEDRKEKHLPQSGRAGPLPCQGRTGLHSHQAPSVTHRGPPHGPAPALLTCPISDFPQCKPVCIWGHSPPRSKSVITRLALHSCPSHPSTCFLLRSPPLTTQFKEGLGLTSGWFSPGSHTSPSRVSGLTVWASPLSTRLRVS